MSSALLPASSTPWERALADAMPASQAAVSAINAMRRVKYVSPRPSMLPFLVWEYGLGELTPYLPNLYNLVDQGVRWQRLRGSASAVAIGLAWVGYTANIEEAWTGRRWWNSFQLRFPALPAQDAPDLERIEGVAALSVPKRSQLRRGVHAYDAGPLEANTSRLNDSHLSVESGIAVTQAGTIWSFGRTHETTVRLERQDGIDAGYWIEPDWLNPLAGSPRWSTLDQPWQTADFLWSEDQTTQRQKAMAGWFTGKALYLRLERANGEPIGYRLARASHLVVAQFAGPYTIGDVTYAPIPAGGQLLYVEAMTQFDDVDGEDVAEVALIVGAEPAEGIPVGRAWLEPGDLTGGVAIARTPVSVRLRKTVRDQFKFLLRFDIEPVPPLAMTMLGDRPNGMSFGFEDDSYAKRSTSIAEIILLAGAYMAFGFPDDSYAVKED